MVEIVTSFIVLRRFIATPSTTHPADSNFHSSLHIYHSCFLEIALRARSQQQHLQGNQSAKTTSDRTPRQCKRSQPWPSCVNMGTSHKTGSSPNLELKIPKVSFTSVVWYHSDQSAILACININRASNRISYIFFLPFFQIYLN